MRTRHPVLPDEIKLYHGNILPQFLEHNYETELKNSNVTHRSIVKTFLFYMRKSSYDALHCTGTLQTEDKGMVPQKATPMPHPKHPAQDHHPPAAPRSWDMAGRCLSPGVAASSAQLCQATALCVQTALRPPLL